MYDLIIIGGGPAGVTAGIYGVRKGLRTLVITKDFLGQAGGAVLVENWPGEKSISGAELMQKFEEHLKHFNPKIEENTIIKSVTKKKEGFKVVTGEKEFEGKAVIIASGRNPRPLKVPGEEKFSGKGISYCVTCDGAFFKEKEVAVVGGGNSGFMAALELKDYCKKVYVLEMGNKVGADEIYQKRLEEVENAEIITGARLKEIKGEEAVEFLTYEKEGEAKELRVDGVFVEVGSVPATEFVGDLVEFNERGEIKIDPVTTETKTKGLFAAGDVTDVRDKQIIVACAEGEKATLSAYDYLRGAGSEPKSI